MIEYDIHGLVTVIVDPRVGAPVIDCIDFQIGAFRVEGKRGTTENGDRAKLEIGAYRDMPASESNEREAVFDDPEAQLAVGRVEGGLKAYVETGNFTVNVLVQIVLAERLFTQVHAAGVVDGTGAATLFPGKGGVGKTALSGFLVKERGYRLLGDDLVIVGSEGSCYSIPRAFVLKNYHRKMFPEAFKNAGAAGWWRWDFDLGGLLVANMPFKGLIRKSLGRSSAYLAAAKALSVISSGGAVVPIHKIFGSEKIARSGVVRRVVYLERSGSRFEVCGGDRAEMRRKMFAVIHGEFRGSMGGMFDMGAAGVVDLAKYFASVDRSIGGCMEAAEVLRLKIPEGATAEGLGKFYSKEILGE